MHRARPLVARGGRRCDVARVERHAVSATEVERLSCERHGKRARRVPVHSAAGVALLHGRRRGFAAGLRARRAVRRRRGGSGHLLRWVPVAVVKHATCRRSLGERLVKLATTRARSVSVRILVHKEHGGARRGSGRAIVACACTRCTPRIGSRSFGTPARPPQRRRPVLRSSTRRGRGGHPDVRRCTHANPPT
jgi:hypothetical protein